MPFVPEAWLADRKARMADALHRLARVAKAGAIPGGSIEDGTLNGDRLNAAVPKEADALMLDLYGRLPQVVVHMRWPAAVWGCRFAIGRSS